MLRSLKDLEKYTVTATDGDIGRVENVLFDDQHWTVRHLVVDTKGILDRRRVLLSPVSLGHVDWSTHRFHVTLNRLSVQNSPDVDTDKPVSRQHEREFYSYYQYPLYWGYAGAWGAAANPGELVTGAWKDVGGSSVANDVHLRSLDEVRRYHVQGTDGSIGHIEDLLVDDETWTIRYLVVDTSNWWGGKKVLVAPQWAKSISWDERLVHVALTRDQIKKSPEWNPSAGVNREFEIQYFDYYGKPVYWQKAPPPARTAQAVPGAAPAR